MNQEHATHEQGDRQPPEPESPRKLAVPALFISLIVPGLGHLFLGLRARAFAWLGSYMAFALWVAPGRPGAIFLVSAAAAVDAYVMAITSSAGPEDSADAPPRDAWKPLR